MYTYIYIYIYLYQVKKYEKNDSAEKSKILLNIDLQIIL